MKEEKGRLEDISKYFNWEDIELMEKYPSLVESTAENFPGSNYGLIEMDPDGEVPVNTICELERKVRKRNLKGSSDAMKIVYIGRLWDYGKDQIINKIQREWPFSTVADFLGISESEFYEYIESGVDQPLPSPSEMEWFLNTGNSRRKKDIQKMKKIGSVVVNDYNTLKTLIETTSKKIAESENKINAYNSYIERLEEDKRELEHTLSNRDSREFGIYETGEYPCREISKAVKLEGLKSVIDKYESKINEIKRKIGDMKRYMEGWKAGIDKIREYSEEVGLDLKLLEKENSWWLHIRPFPDDRYWLRDEFNKIMGLTEEISLTPKPGKATWDYVVDRLFELNDPEVKERYEQEKTEREKREKLIREIRGLIANAGYPQAAREMVL